MRYTWKVALSVAALLTATSPAFANSTLADSQTTSQITVDPQDQHSDPSHRVDPGLANRGDPTRPASDPFLPQGMAVPQVGPRSHSPLPVGTDLALNLPYNITTQWPDPTFHAVEENYPDRGQLTDGKFASLSLNDPQWVGFYRQYDRDITINLGKVENIHALSLDFLHDAADGIALPNQVTYSVSQDGVNWQPVGRVQASYAPGDYSIQTDSFELNNVNVNAHYVRAEFGNKLWSFVDQFSVYGYAQSNPAAPTPRGFPVRQSPPLGYMTSSNPASGGVNNMMLAYTDGHGDLGTWTESDFAPMVADETPSGTPKSWMFDSVLFLPYPNGYFPTTASAWSGYVQNLFTPNIQLSALDQAVAASKQALHDPNYKEKVIIAIPETDADPSNFGSITPGGPNLDFNPNDNGAFQAYLDKVHAIRWYVQQVMDEWNKARFKNLQLVGFYWFQEQLDTTETYDPQLVKSTSMIVHANRKLLYWIPYYGAYGIPQWKQLGFDSVMIQPNVSFNWSIDPGQRLSEVAAMAKQYGTGMEIEAHWDVTSSDPSLSSIAQNRYFDYFTAANVFGMPHNTLFSYYLNSKTLVSAYQMSDPYFHQVYDNTATFIDGLWTGTTFQ